VGRADVPDAGEPALALDQDVELGDNIPEVNVDDLPPVSFSAILSVMVPVGVFAPRWDA
jgi:hypothetical protein